MTTAHGPLTAVPSFVTHYYRADRRPFLNLSDLTESEAATVVAELAHPVSKSCPRGTSGRGT